MAKTERYSQFEFITYPESMGDIYEKVKELALTLVRSPLHEDDYNKDGEILKPHYHNMIIFSSLHSKQQIDEICSDLGIKHWEKTYDRRQKLRYYCHLDSNEKAEYNPADVFIIGDFDYRTVLNKGEGPNPHRDFIKYLNSIEVNSFRSLVNKVNSERPEFLYLLIDKTFFYYQYVRKDQ